MFNVRRARKAGFGETLQWRELAGRKSEAFEQISQRHVLSQLGVNDHEVSEQLLFLQPCVRYKPLSRSEETVVLHQLFP